MRLGIVAIGYNREACLERLLCSLNECEYGTASPLLIVSVDRAEKRSVEELAEQFQWKHGEKIVKTFSERQGLRRHIMHCGDYMEEYDLDAIAVFEDDIVPSAGFYHYMEQAVGFYKGCENIAGIALYSHRWNPIADRPFCPMENGYDAYFSYFACSWGQIWLRKQWKKFVEWCETFADEKCEKADMPAAVKGWKNSWLKYHIAYCVCENKYFVYPYKSFATCFADEGEHTELNSIKYQVPVAAYSEIEYYFVDVAKGCAVYDAYFENKALAGKLAEEGFDTCVDLYGIKGRNGDKQYWLSLAPQPYKIVKTMGLIMKPHEDNVFRNIAGNDIFLYDTAVNNQEVRDASPFSFSKFLYYFNGSLEKKAFFFYLKTAFRNRFHIGKK